MITNFRRGPYTHFAFSTSSGSIRTWTIGLGSLAEEAAGRKGKLFIVNVGRMMTP